MTPSPWEPTGEPLVLHVIPTPLARGAQREARALVDQLHAPGRRVHVLLSIFAGDPEVRPDLTLGVDGGRTPAQGYDVKVIPALRAALARLDPGLVVAHGSDPLKYLVPAMVGRRRPLAYYAIGTYAGSRHRRPQLWMWRHLLKRVDAVAAEGDEVAAECTELLGVPADRVTMTPNGRDPEIFSPRRIREAQATQDGPLPSVEEDSPMVTFVGALTEGKRPDKFVEVVAGLREQGAAFRAQVVGDGPLRSSVEGPAAAAGVSMRGSRSDVAELLRQSDMMVFPSLPAGEGMPGVLIEAGLSGLPAVATDVPGVRTIVEDGVTGLIVDVDDREAMIGAVAGLLGDANRRRAMGAAARRRCVDRFSLSSVTADWLRVLGPLLPEAAHGDRSGPSDPDPSGPVTPPGG
ncbi:MAG: glycosyltransferase family 4 protein [Acidimicrobiales bacterium]